MYLFSSLNFDPQNMLLLAASIFNFRQSLKVNDHKPLVLLKLWIYFT